MKKIFIIFALLSLFGCTSKAEKIALDKESLANPEYVGTLPNGQKIYRVQLRDTPDGEYHFVYYTDNVMTMNEAVTRSDGKTQTVDRYTYAMINGQNVPVDVAKKAIQKAEEKQAQQ